MSCSVHKVCNFKGLVPSSGRSRYEKSKFPKVNQFLMALWQIYSNVVLVLSGPDV